MTTIHKIHATAARITALLQRRRAGTCAHTFARCDVMAYVWL